MNQNQTGQDAAKLDAAHAEIFTVSEIAAAFYAHQHNVLNQIAQRIMAERGLSDTLEFWHRYHEHVGFVEDDLRSVERYQLRCPTDPEKRFYAQFNSKRLMRHAGKGRTEPPQDVIPKHGNCFLCNVEWQQRGLQFGLEIRLAELDWVFYTNPFPLMPEHFTVALKHGRPQDFLTW